MFDKKWCVMNDIDNIHNRIQILDNDSHINERFNTCFKDYITYNENNMNTTSRAEQYVVDPLLYDDNLYQELFYSHYVYNFDINIDTTTVLLSLLNVLMVERLIDDIYSVNFIKFIKQTNIRIHECMNELLFNDNQPIRRYNMKEYCKMAYIIKQLKDYHYIIEELMEHYYNNTEFVNQCCSTTYNENASESCDLFNNDNELWEMLF